MSVLPSMPVIINADKVWFDEGRKLENLCADAAAAQANGQSVLLLSHFESSITLVGAALRARGVAYERFSSLNPSELCGNRQAKIWLGSAGAFQVPNQTTFAVDGPRSEIRLEIMVAE